MCIEFEDRVIERGAEICALVSDQAGLRAEIRPNEAKVFKFELFEDLLHEICVDDLIRDLDPRIGIEHIHLGDYVTEFAEVILLDRFGALELDLFSRSAERLAEGRTGRTISRAERVFFVFL